MVVAVVAIGFALYQSGRAVQAALDGKAALLRAETSLGAREFGRAKGDLARAKADFEDSQSKVRTLARYLPFARSIPLVGSQLRGVTDLSEAGVLLSDAGVTLVDASAGILEPADPDQGLSEGLPRLRRVQELVQAGGASIDTALAMVDRLEGERLVRPLGRARTDLAQRLPEIRGRATAAEQSLASLISFAGGDGPRRYLVLFQNPDEVRPTGGFINTYGVLVAVDGNLSLERYESIESWTGPRPDAVATPAERGSPLRFDTRVPQSLANVNTWPDWPLAAQLATRLWERGGEQKVDGVVTFTPASLASILGVVGPVSIDAYGETVTAANVIERIDFHTHLPAPEPGPARKEFVAVLAQAVLTKLFDAPASQWDGLAGALGTSFGDREAMAWSTDGKVAEVVAARGWDGSIPVTAGDFVYPAEFGYRAKNGRDLRRTYDHHVVIRTDGSAQITTVVKIVNPADAHPDFNPPDALAYVTMYGPAGAVLDGASDPLGVPEPSIAGHPGYGWFRTVAPRSEANLKAVWEVPAAAFARPDGTWEYFLVWMRLPDHTGDVLQLSFELPAGWSWVGEPPPEQYPLDRDVDQSWLLRPDS